MNILCFRFVSFGLRLYWWLWCGNFEILKKLSTIPPVFFRRFITVTVKIVIKAAHKKDRAHTLPYKSFATPMRIMKIVEIQTNMSTCFKMAKPLNVMIGIKWTLTTTKFCVHLVMIAQLGLKQNDAANPASWKTYTPILCDIHI